jgi:hypothetical protein
MFSLVAALASLIIITNTAEKGLLISDLSASDEMLN